MNASMALRDLARKGVATASNVYPCDKEKFSPSHVIDGNRRTRWGTDYDQKHACCQGQAVPDAWIQVELAEDSTIDSIVLDWETAYARQYQIEASYDGVAWEPVQVITEGQGGREHHQLNIDYAVKYLRMQGIEPGTRFGYSLRAFEVYGPAQPGAAPASLLPTPPKTSVAVAPPRNAQAVLPRQAPMEGVVIPKHGGGSILPTPVEWEAKTGSPFTLTSQTRIRVRGRNLEKLGTQLAGYLRASTGFPLPVEAGSGSALGDIELELDPGIKVGSHKLAQDEGYQLTVTTERVLIRAASTHGLFNGIQTLRQLLPPWIEDQSPHQGPWEITPVLITDYPRFGYRGLMLDPARNFIEIDEVKQVIEQLAALKANRLQLHLTDNQGWRIEIVSWPKLTSFGAFVSAAPHRKTGFYTQEEMKDLIAYAADHFVEIIPEIDMPAHAAAAARAYPEIADANNYIDTEKEVSYQFISDVVGEIAALFPSPLLHIGGDEADKLESAKYIAFLKRVETIVRSHGKTMVAWTPAPKADSGIDVVHHYWADRNNEMKPGWFANARKVLLSPTEFSYLDFPYKPGSTHGGKVYDIERSYSWDPTTLSDQTTKVSLTELGLKEENILGIQGCIWSSLKLYGLPKVLVMVWPREAGLLEKAWSPKVLTQDVREYVGRLSHLGVRWQFAGHGFHADAKVPWIYSVIGSLHVVKTGEPAAINGTVASLAAPGAQKDDFKAIINWGDGTTSTGVLTGDEEAEENANSIYRISGSHTYSRPGNQHGKVTVSGPDGYKQTVDFSIFQPQ